MSIGTGTRFFDFFLVKSRLALKKLYLRAKSRNGFTFQTNLPIGGLVGSILEKFFQLGLMCKQTPEEEEIVTLNHLPSTELF